MVVRSARSRLKRSGSSPLCFASPSGAQQATAWLSPPHRLGPIHRLLLPGVLAEGPHSSPGRGPDKQENRNNAL